MMTDMGDQSSSYSVGLLSPKSRPGKLPREDLLRPPSPTSLPMARPGRALSEARITLEKERQRVERDKTRPDWVIDLDDMEVGIKEWTRPTKARAILLLGGESSIKRAGAGGDDELMRRMMWYDNSSRTGWKGTETDLDVS